MIERFGNRETQDIFEGRSSKSARKVLPTILHRKAQERMIALLRLTNLLEAKRLPPNWRFKELHGHLRGTYQVRIDRKYRLRFRWEDGPVRMQVGEWHDEDDD